MMGGENESNAIDLERSAQTPRDSGDRGRLPLGLDHNKWQKCAAIRTFDEDGWRKSSGGAGSWRGGDQVLPSRSSRVHTGTGVLRWLPL
jgi:hypothetical protein